MLYDLVKGSKYVHDTKKWIMWCDASNIALEVTLGICVEAEDAAWLRKKDDYNHINVAELDVVLKTVSLALRWRL